MVPALPLVHLVLEHLLRQRALRHADRRPGLAVHQGAGSLRAVAQHPLHHAGARSRRVLALSADAAPSPARELRLRRHPPRLLRPGRGQPSTSADNLYAAMPSLHIGWATWITLSLWPLVRRPWAKALLVAYPTAQLFCTVVTANHFFLDAVGGWAVLGLAYSAGFAHPRNGAGGARCGPTRSPPKIGRFGRSAGFRGFR